MSKKRKVMAKATLRPPRVRRPRQRIHIVKEYSASRTGHVGDAINDYLGNRSEGDPRVVDIHPFFARSPLIAEEGRVLVVIERDERRSDPGRKPRGGKGPGGLDRRKHTHPAVVASLVRRRNGEDEPAEVISGLELSKGVDAALDHIKQAREHLRLERRGRRVALRRKMERRGK